MSPPVFAVVGHPNKGKSSMVATLSRDDSVAIGPEPGTTTVCRAYPMRLDGEVLYTLVDTPGFQRARAALAWMRKRETTADEHPAVVRAFVDRHRGTPRFPDEVELLQPLVDGAGILYVVDGSVPYGPEYEAEMTILQWTGCPRMGLINPIGGEAFIENWRTALDQYFSVVRVFDAVHSDVHRRLDLLRTFGQLHESWRAPLDRAADGLEADQAGKRASSASILADALHRMIRLRLDAPFPEDGPAAGARERLESKYRDELKRMEKKARDRIEEIYDLPRIELQDGVTTPLSQQDLFAETTWRLFGLSRAQLLGLGVVGGAAAGGVVDVMAGGTSFLLGTLIGSVIGAGSILAAGETLAKVRIFKHPLGGKRIAVGPMQSINFPFVVLNRARLHHRLIANRTHAQRDPINLEAALLETLPPLDASTRKTLSNQFRKLRDDRQADTAREGLAVALDDLLRNDDA